MFHRVVCDILHDPSSPVKQSLLVIAAEQLLGHLVLLRHHPAGNKQHWAGKSVEVVAHDHRNSFGIAHGGIDLLEERNWTRVACDTRAGIQLHIIHRLTWRTADRKRCECTVSINNLSVGESSRRVNYLALCDYGEVTSQ